MNSYVITKPKQRQMLNDLKSQYDKDVQACRLAVIDFVANDKPNYTTVPLGEAYKLRELDGMMTQLTLASLKLEMVQNIAETKNTS